MATIVRREVRKRGFFGWVFLAIFICWNALMLLSLISGIQNVGESMETSAMPDATAAGATLGLGLLIVIWAAGAIVTGLLALFTRGSKTIIEETVS